MATLNTSNHIHDFPRGEMFSDGAAKPFPEGDLVYDYCFDQEVMEWVPWMSTVTPYRSVACPVRRSPADVLTALIVRLVGMAITHGRACAIIAFLLVLQRTSYSKHARLLNVSCVFLLSLGQITWRHHAGIDPILLCVTRISVGSDRHTFLHAHAAYNSPSANVKDDEKD